MAANSGGLTLTGWEPERLANFGELSAAYEGVTDEDMYANFKYFLDAIIPTCDEYDVRMGVHPDDPPFDIVGWPRVVSTKQDLEGVQVLATADPGARTGLMVKEQLHGTPWRIRYYRDGSAASRLSPADLDPAVVRRAIAHARVLHVTGITAALSERLRSGHGPSGRPARAAGVLVSFDVNYRAALWPAGRAVPVLAELCGAADVVFAGVAEAALVLPSADATDEEALARGLVELGADTVVLKLGARGALAVSGDRTVHAAADPVDVVDEVGAGDAFVAGFLSGLVEDASIAECLRRGNRLGGAVCRVRGDWEGLPTREELGCFGSVLEDVVR